MVLRDKTPLFAVVLLLLCALQVQGQGASCRWSLDWTSRTGQYRMVRTEPLALSTLQSADREGMMIGANSLGGRELVLAGSKEEGTEFSEELVMTLRNGQRKVFERSRLEEAPAGEGRIRRLSFYAVDASEWAWLRTAALQELSSGGRILRPTPLFAKGFVEAMDCVDGAMPLRGSSALERGAPVGGEVAGGEQTGSGDDRPPTVGSTAPDTVTWHTMDQVPVVLRSSAYSDTVPVPVPPAQAPASNVPSSTPGPQPSGPGGDDLSYRSLTEPPEQFAALSVYTVLHVFSEVGSLDTFRIVTYDLGKPGLRHELHINTANGKRYKEELFPVPLEGVTPSGSRGDAELELLRVRMNLSPGAFRRNPVAVSDWQLSDVRDSRDLVYDLSKEEFKLVFMERPVVGFKFNSDPLLTKELVYSHTLGRIVNVLPE